MCQLLFLNKRIFLFHTDIITGFVLYRDRVTKTIISKHHMKEISMYYFELMTIVTLMSGSE